MSVDQLNAKARYPESSDFRDGNAASGHWYEDRDGRIVRVEQVVGGSSVYLIETDHETGEGIADNIPWQLRA